MCVYIFSVGLNVGIVLPVFFILSVMKITKIYQPTFQGCKLGLWHLSLTVILPVYSLRISTYAAGICFGGICCIWSPMGESKFVFRSTFISVYISLSCLHVMLYNFLQDLPLDPTGQLDIVRAFIEENIGICKWVGIVVLTIQVCFST